jgi:hypothetical protein
MTEIYDRVRVAIQESEKSRYRLSKETGISQSALCLFMQKKRGLSGDRLEDLAKSLGMRLILEPDGEVD